MAKEVELLGIRGWFNIYIKQFCTGNERFDSAICLKVRHTKNVALEIVDISNSLNLVAEDCCLAEIMAILHDIGRFEQYTKYHTYSDLKSEDHALLGINVIRKTGVLSKLRQDERELVEKVVTYHNRAILPESNDSRFLFFLKLLRDADKIDIYNIVTEHYCGFNTNNAINLGLPDIPEVSEAIIHSINNGEIAKMGDLRSINDFKLMQISWVFDLNFPRTFTIVNKNEYIDKLASKLPQTDNVLHALSLVRKYLMSKLH